MFGIKRLFGTTTQPRAFVLHDYDVWISDASVVCPLHAEMYDDQHGAGASFVTTLHNNLEPQTHCTVVGCNRVASLQPSRKH